MGRNRKNSTRSTKRDDSDIATDSEVLRSFIQKPKPYQPVTFHLSPHTQLAPVQDRRTWHPDKHKSLLTTASQPHRLTLRKKSAVSVSGPSRTTVGNSRTGTLPHQVAFDAPKTVLLCIRRKRRRAVLFAKNRTGKGAHARKHRNQWSDVTC